MKPLIITTALCALLLPAAAMAKPKPINAIEAATQVEQTERDFDAFTHVHGYTKGFFQYSAPDAVTFHPGAFAIHAKLNDDLKTDSTDKPSKLRWGPHWVGMAGSRDMAWDLGPWWVEGTDNAGWFFTVWQRQADGTWLWVLDGGAGPDKPGNLPKPADNVRSFDIGVSPTPETSAGEASGLDDAYNAALAAGTAQQAYKSLGWTLPDIVAGDSAPPTTSAVHSTTLDADRNAMLATRPQGLTWARDGQGGSSGGDMVYTYGHASAADGIFKGHYVRVWHKLSAEATAWVVTADIYQAAQ